LQKQRDFLCHSTREVFLLACGLTAGKCFKHLFALRLLKFLRIINQSGLCVAEFYLFGLINLSARIGILGQRRHHAAELGEDIA
jgi:hypothetical protein